MSPSKKYKFGSSIGVLFTILEKVLKKVKGRISTEIEVLIGIKVPITFSRKSNILNLLSDLSSKQLQEILEAKSDYAKAVMLDLFQINLPISYKKIDELIIKLTSSLMYQKDEELLQILINLITLKEILDFLND
jgi:hypothetical protein